MNTLIYSLSATPAFAGRAFLATFIIASAARVAPHVTFFSEKALQVLGSAPDWIISNGALSILGILALVEITADKIPESREIYFYIEEYFKPAVMFLVTTNLLTPEAAEAIKPLLGMFPAESDSFAFSLPIATIASVTVIPSSISGFLSAFSNACFTWFLIRTKKRLYQLIMESDEDDDAGILGISSWLTDITSFLLLVCFIFLPLIAFILLGITLLLVMGIRVYLRRQEGKTQVSCPLCNTVHSASALVCPSCKTETPSPRKLSFLGLATNPEPVVDKETHRFHLLSWRRCPSCAEHLPDKTPSQTCSTCSRQVFSDLKEAEAYFSYVKSKLPLILGISCLLSFIPIIGLIVGVLYYRLGLIAGMKKYIPPFHTFIGRWFIRIINFCVLWLQPIPIIGAVTVPIMCLTNYLYYKNVFLKQCYQQLYSK